MYSVEHPNCIQVKVEYSPVNVDNLDQLCLKNLFPV